MYVSLLHMGRHKTSQQSADPWKTPTMPNVSIRTAMENHDLVWWIMWSLTLRWWCVCSRMDYGEKANKHRNCPCGCFFDTYHLTKHCCRPCTPFHENAVDERGGGFRFQCMGRSMEVPSHNVQDLKDLLLTPWCHIPQQTFRALV